MRGIKIEYRCFHANCSAQTDFEAGAAEVFNEARQIARTVQRKPLDGLTRFSGDGCEGAPFMRDQAGIPILVFCALAVRETHEVKEAMKKKSLHARRTRRGDGRVPW